MGEGEVAGDGLRQGVPRARDLPGLAAPPRARRGPGALPAAAGDHRPGRQRRHRRGADRRRGRGLRHARCAQGGARGQPGRQDRGHHQPHGALQGRPRLWPGGGRTQPGRGGSRAQGRGGGADPFHRHQLRPLRPHRHHALCRRRAAHPRRGAVQPRRRPDRTHGRARQAGAPAPGHRRRNGGRLHLAQRHRRDPRPRPARRSRHHRRPPRFLGPGHGRDRRRRRRRHHLRRRRPDRPA